MARHSKRIFKNQVAEIIGNNMANLNAISHSSGISHTYLTKLVQGHINRPGKDKIASTLLAIPFVPVFYVITRRWGRRQK